MATIGWVDGWLTSLLRSDAGYQIEVVDAAGDVVLTTSPHPRVQDATNEAGAWTEAHPAPDYRRLTRRQAKNNPYLWAAWRSVGA